MYDAEEVYGELEDGSSLKTAVKVILDMGERY